MSGKSSFTFSQVPSADIPRATFNRNHNYKTTFDSGFLIPFYVDEALPGDTFNVSMSAFARLATPIVPIMDNMYMDFFFFAVPNRLLWNNWQRFCGEQPSPGDSTDFVVPQITMNLSGYDTGSVMDYMGVPPKLPFQAPYPNALHFRAYNLIWNEWFRDQNLQPPVTVNKGDGPDPYTDYNLLRRGKRHDYFTSCLPWPQKGPGVEIPIAGTPVVASSAGAPSFYRGDAAQHFMQTGPASANNAVALSGNTIGTLGNITWNNPALQVGAGGGTINDLRQAFAIQKLLERDARGGTRYTEILRAHFKVESPDARLQRPEYLGGGSTNVVINPVTQTNGTPTDPSGPNGAATPQGNLAAYGVAGGRAGFTKSFVEHCCIVGLVMVRADLSYQQGLNRMWTRRTRNDYYWPAFSHLGEQAVYGRELDVSAGGANSAVFGYQERFAEYRYHPSLVTGKFRTGAAGTLDYWHLSQDLTLPTLNATFIEERPPVDRVVAVPSEPQFLFDSHFTVKCARPMPLYSVPGLTDHF